MRWPEAILIAFISLALISCGKNDPIRPLGTPIAPNKAPAPPSYAPGGNFAPNTFFPQTPMGNFRPQMPMGQPSQYYPFVPLDNYMRRDPRLQQYWDGYWRQWQGYAQRNRINQYDFSKFWFDYCPNQWSHTQFGNLYNYMDSNFYYWTQPGTQFPVQNGNVNFSVDYFWGNAYDFPMPQYDLCDSGC